MLRSILREWVSYNYHILFFFKHQHLLWRGALVFVSPRIKHTGKHRYTSSVCHKQVVVYCYSFFGLGCGSPKLQSNESKKENYSPHWGYLHLIVSMIYVALRPSSQLVNIHSRYLTCDNFKIFLSVTSDYYIKIYIKPDCVRIYILEYTFYYG